MSFGKASGQFRPQYVVQSRAEPERKVSFWLWLGIVSLPLPFAFFTLAKGYSARARIISLGYVGLLTIPALIFGGHDQPAPSQVQSAQASSVSSVPALDPELAASQARLKQSTADLAYTYLITARLDQDESAEHFNARVTKLYNDWVSAEQKADGQDWQQAYLNRERQDRDCSDLYGPFSHNDAQLRQARAACAAAAYAPAPTVPTLDDFLMKPEATPAQADDVQPVSDYATNSEE